ncbi:hypothetical protein KR009_002779 [Drosophila setifemur]|nr:hypothetical protein KR009_002779 [Drosophila setifemur]
MNPLYQRPVEFTVDDEEFMPSNVRSYGFMRATKTYTPMPKVKADMNHLELFNSLKDLADLKETSDSNGSIDADGTSKEFGGHGVRQVRELTAFEKKRKLFDNAEFTITRGLKLSDTCHPIEAGIRIGKSSIDRYSKEFKAMEALCRDMNFELDN